MLYEFKILYNKPNKSLYLFASSCNMNHPEHPRARQPLLVEPQNRLNPVLLEHSQPALRPDYTPEHARVRVAVPSAGR